MTLDQAKWNLATVWLVGSGLLLVAMVVETLGEYFGDRSSEAWGWFLPTVVPTLSLMIGVLVADYLAQQSNKERPLETTRLFRLAAGLSSVYLLLVAASILIPVFDIDEKSLELMQLSNYWLAPLQGLTAAVLGAFFLGPRPQ